MPGSAMPCASPAGATPVSTALITPSRTLIRTSSRPAAWEQSVPEKHVIFHCTGSVFCSYCIYNHSKPAKGYFMRADCVFTNASLATMAPDRPGLGVVEDGMVAAVAGRIVYAGPAQDLRRRKSWIAAGAG